MSLREHEPKYGTAFLESEAMLAAIADDANYLAKCLMGMSEAELRGFLRTLDNLRRKVHEWVQLREL